MVGTPGGGGGGGVLPYVCILGMCRVRDPHFQPWISVSEHIIFTNYHTQKKSVPEHHHFTFLGGFCRSGDHHFQNFFNFNPFIASHGRLSPNAKRSAAPRVSGRSGDSHFHARPGARSGALAHFSLCRGTYLPRFGVSTPPPPRLEQYDKTRRPVRQIQVHVVISTVIVCA